MSEEEKPFYVAMTVKAMPIPPIPSVKMMCSGGCWEEVWVDKKLERLWSKMPVLCLECALRIMDFKRDSFVVAPETIDSVMKFMINRDMSRNL